MSQRARSPEEQLDDLKQMKVQYALAVKLFGEASPEALELRELIAIVRGRIRVTRLMWVYAFKSVAAERGSEAALWRRQLTILAISGPRNDPPLYVHEPLDVPASPPPWSPWTGLAPPDAPTLVQRQ